MAIADEQQNSVQVWHIGRKNISVLAGGGSGDEIELTGKAALMRLQSRALVSEVESTAGQRDRLRENELDFEIWCNVFPDGHGRLTLGGVTYQWLQFGL